VVIMPKPKTLAEWMTERGIDAAKLATLSALDRRVVEALAHCRYTSSPDQRQSISAALGLTSEQILWGGAGAVDHIYGHGPQFGRSP
jgi:hypothetical protein